MNFQELDEAIIAHVQQGLGHATNSSALEAIARRLVEEGLAQGTLGGRRPPVAWRLIKRRMQALKEAGRIVYDGQRRHWQVI